MPAEGDVLDGATPLSAFEEHVARAGSDTLVELLSERHPLYAGRSSGQVARMRGFMLARFASIGVSPTAMPYVLEELQNGRHPYSVAAAARAVRGASPSSELARLLVVALQNVRAHDDAVDLSSASPTGHRRAYTTAVSEILGSLRWLAGHARDVVDDLQALAVEPSLFSPAHASALLAAIEALRATPPPARACCAARSAALATGRGESNAREGDLRALGEVPLTDQDGRASSFADYYGGHLALVAFFYTRCDNPNKCSLTITRLARLQRRLADTRVRVSAMTYDPTHDLPPLLKTYGQERGFAFSEAHRFFRPEPRCMPDLARVFGLGVSYAGSRVNHHRIELFLLEDGRVREAFTRLQWDDAQVVAAIG